MSNDNEYYFDAAALLSLGCLNARHFAEKFRIKTKAYFKMLTKLLALAEDADIALNKFIHKEGDIDAYKILDNTVSMLKRLECENFIIELYSVIGAYETGNWRLAAYQAEKLQNVFKTFHTSLASAKRTAEALPPPDTDVSLKEYLDSAENTRASQKPIVLAVDDSPVVLKSVSSVLSGDYKVYTLPKPAMLENLLRRVTPALFLLDYRMPEISGFDLIPIIRSHDAHKETPIVFLTSEGTVDNVMSALSLGACDFIVKPFVPDALREKIAKWIAAGNTVM